jgi:hypothetical protein
MKTILTIMFAMMLVGCDERYRYPCQDPHNWEKELCKKPFCSGNGTCPEDLAHYLKETDKNKQIPQTPINKGACK